MSLEGHLEKTGDLQVVKSERPVDHCEVYEANDKRNAADALILNLIPVFKDHNEYDHAAHDENDLENVHTHDCFNVAR